MREKNMKKTVHNMKVNRENAIDVNNELKLNIDEH